MAFSNEQLERYSRHIILKEVGAKGQKKLINAKVLIIGVGEFLTGYLLTYDALKMEFRKVKLPRDPHCAICGDHPTITELIDYEQPACDLRKH